MNHILYNENGGNSGNSIQRQIYQSLSFCDEQWLGVNTDLFINQ
jgi:hypothetical protein